MYFIENCRKLSFNNHQLPTHLFFCPDYQCFVRLPTVNILFYYYNICHSHPLFLHMLPTSDHGVASSNPTRGEIVSEPKQHFIAQSLSYSPFNRPDMTEILLKGMLTTNSSIHLSSRFLTFQRPRRKELSTSNHHLICILLQQILG